LSRSIPGAYCEELRFEVRPDWKKSLLVVFGRESRLRSFRIGVPDFHRLGYLGWWDNTSSAPVFCRLSERQLKVYRGFLEFGCDGFRWIAQVRVRHVTDRNMPHLSTQI
jgi:hypothetical protein